MTLCALHTHPPVPPPVRARTHARGRVLCAVRKAAIQTPGFMDQAVS